MNISKTLVGGLLVIIAILGMGWHVQDFDNGINELDDDITAINEGIDLQLVRLEQASFTRVMATGAADANKILKSLNESNIDKQNVKDYMKRTIKGLDPSKVSDENLDNMTIPELNIGIMQASDKFRDDLNETFIKKAELVRDKTTLKNERERWFRVYLILNSFGLLLGIFGQSSGKR